MHMSLISEFTPSHLRSAFLCLGCLSVLLSILEAVCWLMPRENIWVGASLWLRLLSTLDTWRCLECFWPGEIKKHIDTQRRHLYHENALPYRHSGNKRCRHCATNPQGMHASSGNCTD